MISIHEADKIMAQHVKEFPIVELPLRKAYGLVLRETIKADRDLPPINKVMMDGIAIQSKAYKEGNAIFEIQATQAAGCAALKLKSKEKCIEIMTGAVLPEGADCVIPVEHVHIEDGMATIDESLDVQYMQNVLVKGSDHKKGRILLEAGCVLLPPQIATAASVGKAIIKVSYQPSIGIISTGDEIIDIDQEAEPFQVRKSNSYALHAAFLRTGLFEAAVYHVKDNKGSMLRAFEKILQEHDALVLSGGVSMGKFDYVPEVLKELGVNVLFHKVTQRPGKPFWFGVSKDEKPVFALPGNPLSTQIGAYRHVIPQLKKALGLSDLKDEFARLTKSFDAVTEFTHLLPVKVSSDQRGHLNAAPVAHSGSGDFAALAQSDGVIELPTKQTKYKKGEAFRLIRW